MKYLVEIDETKRLGKNALSILRTIAKNKSGITIHKTQVAELNEDARMIKRMLRARKTGFVDTEKFLSKLKSQL